LKFLYYIKDGKLAMIPVRIGIMDGTNMEVQGGAPLAEGLKVISGIETSTKTTKTRQSQGGPPGPPMF
jgi:hypothetical protein